MKRTILALGTAVVISLFGAWAYGQTLDPAVAADQETAGVYAQLPPGAGMSGHGHHSMGMPGHPSPGIQQYPEGGPGWRLGFTPEQKVKFREMRRRFIGQNAQLIGALVAKKLELQSLWTDPKADPKAIMDKAKEFGDLHGQLREKGLQAMLEARTFLTPEQIARWKPWWAFGHRGMMGRHGGMSGGRFDDRP